MALTRKTFFWKTFFVIFIPFSLVGILSEPYISKNTFHSLEDYGEFLFFLFFYLVVISGISALISFFIYGYKFRQN